MELVKKLEARVMLHATKYQEQPEIRMSGTTLQLVSDEVARDLRLPAEQLDLDGVHLFMGIPVEVCPWMPVGTVIVSSPHVIAVVNGLEGGVE